MYLLQNVPKILKRLITLKILNIIESFYPAAFKKIFFSIKIFCYTCGEYKNLKYVLFNLLYA